ncbi:pseudouridine synthase, partial [Streptomyces lasiicapitis]
ARAHKLGWGPPSKPRPEERRYDVGPGGTHEGPKSGRGASARGGAKGGPKRGQEQRGAGRGRPAPAYSREYETRAEERNRERYAGKPKVSPPKTFPGAEQEGERLQKIRARAGGGARGAGGGRGGEG